jgi:hypothetical protein
MNDVAIISELKIVSLSVGEQKKKNYVSVKALKENVIFMTI